MSKTVDAADVSIGGAGAKVTVGALNIKKDNAPPPTKMSLRKMSWRFVHPSADDEKTCWTKSKEFFNKYFLEGQHLDDDAAKEVADPDAPFYKRHRKFVAFVSPLLVVWSAWWPYMIATDNWDLFTQTKDNGSSENVPRYAMTITMVFGSLIAGATSEGGAAVAFPVMTLAMGIAPPIARDFSFMIQSVGMVAAAFTILFMRVAVEWHSLKFVSVGGVFGLIFGLETVAPNLPPPFTKMLFVGGVTTFAFSLYFLNRTHGRVTVSSIAFWDEAVIWRSSFAPNYIQFNWKAAVLIFGGFIGGTVTGVAGSGIDICSFAMLTLLFRVSEKTATPTSVVLMGLNTALGFAYRQFVQGGVEQHAWGFLAVCAPVVVIGAPLGSVMGSHFHRLTLATMVYIIDTVQLFGAVYVVKPWLSIENGGKTDKPVLLSVLTGLIFVFGGFFFRWLTKTGLKLLGGVEAKDWKARQRAVVAESAAKDNVTIPATAVPADVELGSVTGTVAAEAAEVETAEVEPAVASI